jgi:hypothetical protein
MRRDEVWLGAAAPRLRLPAQGDGIVRVRISEGSDASALDLAGADEPSQVLLYAQLTRLISVDRLRQFQG